VAFIIAAVVHGFLSIGQSAEVSTDCPAGDALTAGPVVEALIIIALGIFLTVLSSIKISGGNSQ